MNPIRRLCIVIVLVGGSAVLDAAAFGPSSASVHTDPVPPTLLATLAQPRIEARTIERLYNDAVVSDGNVDRLLAHLSTASQSDAGSKRLRANAWLVSSHIQWRHGSLTAAVQAADAGLAIDPYGDLVYHKAILLDASGETRPAKEWYEKALAATRDPQLIETIRLRLTFIDAIDQHVDGLIELAKSGTRAFRNRAAIALGILDFNKEAVSLYQMFGAGGDRCRQHLRVAQWAIKAEDAAAAKAEAWSAVQTATLERDRRYGLSLLVEAYRLDDTLPELVTRLAAKQTLTPEEQSVRIELLRQTGQYEQAIEIFKSAHRGGPPSPGLRRASLGDDLRHELLRMYRDAGQSDAMVAEYQRLIASEPGATTWPEGLSQHYFERGDQVSARRVWEDFVTRNADVDTLLLGTESMASLGLYELAMAAIDKAIARSPEIDAVTKARFAQFDLYHRRGLNDEAAAALASLDGSLPPDSDHRTALAEAYERIQRPHLAVTVWERLPTSRGHLGVDERMRLAWLLDSTGRRDDALKMWREMWATETDSPRRRLVEDRLLILAAELGALGDLAIELEEKVALRVAEPRDVSLLVSIYTKVGDSVSAIDALTEAAAQKPQNVSSEITSLKEQAQVYLALNEYQDFARVTRRLVDLDSANRGDHLQALLLNEIERSSADGRDRHGETAQIRSWLTQLREVGGGAAGGEFAAGVMELAGFHDDAIDAYRRELARHPERADNLLLLADLLKQTGRRAEAVASLQYLTEAARDDELFLVAIDGITNMQTGNASTLRWAIRRALERLTARDDKIYLYEMLAELAEDARDARRYVSALENSLAHAHSRRSHVLRELLSTTGDSTLYGTAQGLHRPEPRRHAIYARRLVALDEELPPDVYTDLGRTFLKLNDPASAMHAFNSAVDRSGRTSLVVDAAKQLDEGGYDREAIAQYEKALIADNSNVQAMYKLARLRQRAGFTDSANDLYLQALLAIINRQPGAIERGGERTPPVLDSVITFEHRRFSAYLMKGFLSTLPSANDARLAKLRRLEVSFDEELGRIVAAPQGRLELLAYYPRLKVLARSVSWASRSAGAVDVAERVSAALLRDFPGDESLRGEIDAERVQWGAATIRPVAAEAASATDDLTDVMLQRALDHQEFGTAVGFWLARGNQDAALSAYRAWIRVAGLPKPPTRYGSIELRDAYGMAEVAAHAIAHLDTRRFRTLAEDVYALVSERDPYAEKLLRTPAIAGDVPMLTEIEQVLGRPLFSEEQILRLMRRVDNWRVLCLTCVLSRLSADRQLDILERYVNGSEVNWPNLLTAVGVILSRPVDAVHAARLVPILKGAFQAGLKRADAAWLPNFMNYQFTSKVHEDNAPIVVDIEQFIAEKYPHVFKVGYFTAHLLRDLGRDEEALSAFVDAALKMYAPETDGTLPPAGMPTSYAYKTFVRSFSSFIFPKHAAGVMTLLEQREAREGPTDASISLRVELHNNDPSSDHERLLAALRDMTNRHPDSEPLLRTLFTLYDQWGQTADAVEVVTQLTRLRPENRLYRYRLLSLWQKLDHPENALAVAGGDTVDELSRAVPRNPFIETLGGGPVARFPALKRAVERIKAAAKDGDQAALGLRTVLQALPPAGLSMTEFYRHNADGGEPYLTLRDLVTLNADGVAARTPTPAGQNAHARLVDALELAEPDDQAKRPTRLLDAIVEYSFAPDEIEAYVATLAAVDIDKQYVFYALLVDALAIHGRADEELQQRSEAVLAGTAGPKEVTVWLDLAGRQPPARASQLLQLVHDRGITSAALTVYQRLLVARLFARAGRRDEALATYNAVATALVASSVNAAVPAGAGISADPYGRDNLLPLFTGLGLFEEVRQHLDQDATDRFVAHLIAVSKAHVTTLVEPVYERFVMALYLQALQAGIRITALDQAMPVTPATDGWTRSDLVQAASLRARLGQTEDAMRLVQAALRREFDVAQTASQVPFDKQRAINAYAGVLGVSSATAFSPYAPPSVTGSTIEIFRVLFPVRADAWPGAAAWVSRVARELPTWVAEQSVNRDAAIQVLALVALRLHQLGDKGGVETTAQHLSSLLGAGAGSVKAVSLAVSVTDRIGVPIELSAAQDLVRENRLHVSQIPSVLSRTADVEGSEAALQLGERAARFTSSADLLAQLISIAQTGGREADRLRWVARQSAAANARSALMRRAEPTEPAGQR